LSPAGPAAAVPQPVPVVPAVLAVPPVPAVPHPEAGPTPPPKGGGDGCPWPAAGLASPGGGLEGRHSDGPHAWAGGNALTGWPPSAVGAPSVAP
jgi:hypothetical protein